MYEEKTIKLKIKRQVSKYAFLFAETLNNMDFYKTVLQFDWMSLKTLFSSWMDINVFIYSL